MTSHNMKEALYMLLIILFLFIMILPFFWWRVRWYTQGVSLTPQTKQQTVVVKPISVNDDSRAIVSLASVRIMSEVAYSEEKKKKGLSGRTALDDDKGMLFVFDSKRMRTFGNNDMQFAIDIIWIDDATVVDFSEHFSAFTGTPAQITSSVAVDHVLEVPAGFIQKNSIQKGDTVLIEYE